MTNKYFIFQTKKGFLCQKIKVENYHESEWLVFFRGDSPNKLPCFRTMKELRLINKDYIMYFNRIQDMRNYIESIEKEEREFESEICNEHFEAITYVDGELIRK